MKRILILLLTITLFGCTITTKSTVDVSGEVVHTFVLSEETLAWLDFWAYTTYGQQAIANMPEELQIALYGYVVYPQGDI